jgi:hypothetical protein
LVEIILFWMVHIELLVLFILIRKSPLYFSHSFLFALIIDILENAD